MAKYSSKYYISWKIRRINIIKVGICGKLQSIWNTLCIPNTISVGFSRSDGEMRLWSTGCINLAISMRLALIELIMELQVGFLPCLVHSWFNGETRNYSAGLYVADRPPDAGLDAAEQCSGTTFRQCGGPQLEYIPARSFAH